MNDRQVALELIEQCGAKPEGGCTKECNQGRICPSNHRAMRIEAERATAKLIRRAADTAAATRILPFAEGRLANRAVAWALVLGVVAVAFAIASGGGPR